MKTLFSTKARWMLGAVFALVSAVPVIGAARTTNAILSFANPTDASCFSHSSSGAVINTCTTARRLYLPLTVDTSGAKNISATVYRVDVPNNVTCRAYATSATGGLSSWSASVSAPNTGWQTLSLSGSTVPAGGTAHVYCDLSPNTRVGTVTLVNP